MRIGGAQHSLYETPKACKGDMVSQIVRQLENEHSTNTSSDSRETNDTRCLKVLNGHVAAARCVKWSPCGKKVVPGAYDFTVRIWDARPRDCLLYTSPSPRD